MKDSGSPHEGTPSPNPSADEPPPRPTTPVPAPAVGATTDAARQSGTKPVELVRVYTTSVERLTPLGPLRDQDEIPEPQFEGLFPIPDFVPSFTSPKCRHTDKEDIDAALDEAEEDRERSPFSSPFRSPVGSPIGSPFGSPKVVNVEGRWIYSK